MSPELTTIAMRRGKVLFEHELCSNCHGRDLMGQSAACPNLVDGDWIWGGEVEEIFHTIKFGIRDEKTGSWERVPGTRWSVMPRFEEILSESEIREVSRYVVALSREKARPDTDGKRVYDSHCAACHGSKGSGRTSAGTPSIRPNMRVWVSRKESLEDNVYDFVAYGGYYATSGHKGRKEAAIKKISYPGYGRYMPSFGTDWLTGLADYELKALAVYVYKSGEQKVPLSRR